jgi:hypothetical protein
MNTKLKIINKYRHRDSSKNEQVCFSDIETKIENEKHVVICVSIIDYNNEVFSFTNLDEYFNHIIYNYNDTIIFFNYISVKFYFPNI